MASVTRHHRWWLHAAHTPSLPVPAARRPRSVPLGYSQGWPAGPVSSPSPAARGPSTSVPASLSPAFARSPAASLVRKDPSDRGRPTWLVQDDLPPPVLNGVTSASDGRSVQSAAASELLIRRHWSPRSVPQAGRPLLLQELLSSRMLPREEQALIMRFFQTRAHLTTRFQRIAFAAARPTSCEKSEGTEPPGSRSRTHACPLLLCLELDFDPEPSSQPQARRVHVGEVPA